MNNHFIELNDVIESITNVFPLSPKNGNECWCGDEARYNLINDSMCNKPCAGDGEKMCGGWCINSSTSIINYTYFIINIGAKRRLYLLLPEHRNT